MLLCYSWDPGFPLRNPLASISAQVISADSTCRFQEWALSPDQVNRADKSLATMISSGMGMGLKLGQGEFIPGTIAENIERERNPLQFYWWDVHLNLLEVFRYQGRRAGPENKATTETYTHTPTLTPC